MRKKINKNKCFLIYKITLLLFFILCFQQISFSITAPSKIKNNKIPTLQSGPPTSIHTSYGKEVLLEVTTSDDFSSQNSRIIWIINNKIVCTGLYCPLVLKESDFQKTIPILQIITYNQFGGTTYSYEFEMHPKDTFNAKLFNKETKYLEPIDFPENSFTTQTVSAVMGKGTLIQSDYIMYIGSIGKKFNWNHGVFQTDNLDTLRIADSKSGVWYLLPSTSLTIIENDSSSDIRNGILNYGKIKVKASGIKNDAPSIAENFNNKIKIETLEAIITIPRGGDVAIIREIEKDTHNNFYTKIIVFGGEAYINLFNQNKNDYKKYESNKAVISAGLELKITSDGKVYPLKTPNSSEIDYFRTLTTTEFELKGDVSNSLDLENLNEVLEKASFYIENEAYFETINLLSPYQIYINKDIRISYYLGLAKKGLYQNQEAKKYLVYAKNMNNSFAMAHWNLGLIYLDEKNYLEAEKAFILARINSKSDSKLAHEFEYYVGVAYYFNDKSILANSSFQTAVWDNDLDPALRHSASQYLQKLKIEKPWSLIVPVSLQYDNNALSLGQNQSLPSQYSQKSVMRSLIGGVFTYDTSLSNNDNGWFIGGSGKAFYVKNFSQQYSALDTIILEGSVYETKRWEANSTIKEKSTVKIYETFGNIFVNQKIDTFYFLMGGSYKNLDLNIGLQIDSSNRATSDKKSGIIYNQYYLLNLGQFQDIMFDLSLQAQEQMMFQTSSNVGNTIEFIAKPSATYSLNSKTSLNITSALDILYTFSTQMQSSYKISPAAAINYFFLEWLIGNFTLQFDYSRVMPKNDNIFKPGAQFMVTGIF
ncbi:tetratricopeptide repeat protein [Spirobacillus cienkowskii]|uniref:tetratricopeptide repeat protein n=1 Tax=Spirobacillus cienkowskii TaxID=495820 RepID=UPI0030CA81E5